MLVNHRFVCRGQLCNVPLYVFKFQCAATTIIPKFEQVLLPNNGRLSLRHLRLSECFTGPVEIIWISFLDIFKEIFQVKEQESAMSPRYYARVGACARGLCKSIFNSFTRSVSSGNQSRFCRTRCLELRDASFVSFHKCVGSTPNFQ